MNRFLIRIFIFFSAIGFLVHSYISKQNRLTELRLELPPLMEKVKKIEEKNVALEYEIDRFESPKNLREIFRAPASGNLIFPSTDRLILLPDPVSGDGK